MKNTITSLESIIISMVGDDPVISLLDNPSRHTPLKNILDERCHVLNQMFIPSPENIQRLIQVNKHLSTLTKKLDSRVEQMQIQRPLISDPDFDNDYNIEGHLRVPFYGEEESVLSLPDDRYYGSNFALMINCLDAAYPEPVLRSLPQRKALNDEFNWNEGPFEKYPELKDITICYAIHELCQHRPYSIPDLLRLNSFCCEVQLTAQNFTRQDGSRL